VGGRLYSKDNVSCSSPRQALIRRIDDRGVSVHECGASNTSTSTVPHPGVEGTTSSAEYGAQKKYARSTCSRTTTRDELPKVLSMKLAALKAEVSVRVSNSKKHGSPVS